MKHIISYSYCNLLLDDLNNIPNEKDALYITEVNENLPEVKHYLGILKRCKLGSKQEQRNISSIRHLCKESTKEYNTK